MGLAVLCCSPTAAAASSCANHSVALTCRIHLSQTGKGSEGARCGAARWRAGGSERGKRAKKA